MKPIHIGIDFGTTKTLVSYLSDHSSKPEIAHLGRERYSIPTSAFLGESGTWEFGDDADDYACDPAFADRYTSKFKLKLGSSAPVLQVFNEQGISSYSAREVTAKFLEHIRRRCVREVFNNQNNIINATITHPIHFSPAQLDDLQKAAEQAGFAEVDLVREPEAAGLVFCRLCPQSAFSGTALIVDWGGGTLDLALVSRSNNEVKVHGNYVAGSDSIGGVIFDELLWKHIANRLQKEHGIDISQDTHDAIRLQKKKICAAKEKLSRSETVNLSISGTQGAYPQLRLTRTELEETIHDYVNAGIDGVVHLQESIKEQSLKPTQVLLIGGSSRVPIISKLITKKTGLPCNHWQFSHEAVAMGAAMLVNSPEEICRQADDFIDSGQPEKAFELYQQAADWGYAEGQAGVGLCYMNGEGVTESAEEGIKWLKLAAEQGHPIAQGFLGLYYENGVCVPKSDAEALKWYQLSAAQDDMVGLTGMGKYYVRGEGVVRSYSLAADYFRKAAAKGWTPAQYELGVLHLEGNGVIQSDEEAAKLFRLAADLGDADAQLALGLLYASGKGVPQSDVDSAKWYRLAAEQGNACAEFELGYCFHSGIGVNQSLEECIKWIRKSAEQQYTRAETALGHFYLSGNGVPQSIAEATKLFLRAAENGDADAQLAIGRLYASGNGVPLSATEAAKWYRLSAEQGHASAQYELGKCYINGEGVPQSEFEATKWYELAAEQGHTKAQYELGLCYDVGMGVPWSTFEAAKWYQEAALQGYDKAQLSLGVCYSNGNGVPISATEAVKWYRLAAEQGNAAAQFHYAECLNKGLGVAKSEFAAQKWYILAANQGHEEAQNKLNHPPEPEPEQETDNEKKEKSGCSTAFWWFLTISTIGRLIMYLIKD